MKEKKLVMYMHAGSGNHGCEAIVNSVCHMIKEKAVLVSYYGDELMNCGIAVPTDVYEYNAVLKRFKKER